MGTNNAVIAVSNPSRSRYEPIRFANGASSSTTIARNPVDGRGGAAESLVAVGVRAEESMASIFTSGHRCRRGGVAS